MQPQSETRATLSFTIGQRLEIGYGDEPVHWLATRLEDHDDAGHLTIAWPTDAERRLLPVKPGNTLELAASTPQDALYSAAVTVVETRREPVPLLTVKLIGRWRRIQRRDAVRATVAIKPRIACSVEGEVRKPLHLGITDISCAGIRVRTQEQLRPGDVVELVFELMGVDDELEVQARVARVRRHELGPRTVWDSGCEFEGLSDRISQRIVQFIFAQQRALARTRNA
jgi:c-di-GMP-binding flagellar brake protein YcgR